MKPFASKDGESVYVTIQGITAMLSAQEAHDLHQMLGAILPELVQSLKPWPRGDGK